MIPNHLALMMNLPIRVFLRRDFGLLKVIQKKPSMARQIIVPTDVPDAAAIPDSDAMDPLAMIRVAQVAKLTRRGPG